VLSPELVELLRRFREQHPEVQLTVQDRAPAEQLAAITRGDLDGGFIGLRPLEETPGIQFLAWRREPLSCFVPFGHPLAARKEISLQDLKGESLVAVSSEAAPAFASYVRGLCRKAGFRPRIVLESPRAQAVAVMVAAGAGIALLPDSLSRIVGTAAAVVPLKRPPQITHEFARSAVEPSIAMAAFLETMRARAPRADRQPRQGLRAPPKRPGKRP
jgi:DNA-binding transcriptional LysR family regulator